MGQETSGNNRILTPTETAIEQRTGHSTSDSSTSTTGKKRGRPPGTKREETQLLGLSDVGEPKVVSIEVPGAEDQSKKKAGRPKKAAPQKVDSTQIQLLLVTISGLIASRPGMEIWNLTPEESKQIAEPLSNILSKNEALANAVGEHADSFALVTACFMVFLPKVILYMASKPKKPKEGKSVSYGTEPVTKPQQQERPLRGTSEQNVRPNTRAAKNVNQNFGGQLYELIPSIGGI
jgi:hypothetical protein